ncbi:hypothetical protein CEUSTIGMA_g13800.t1 [Chlamydomonas eustigma]|uniref:Uncharacterized protein n=1 Tax=Chlamydomonas eustigma TaxID=1157962 RepID=A0A250XTT9_9CHLO|nr:hypothetical protein CEUSTIGMA_g13800.t1 [Chlamydomonas eustigma]|eukprot:GAX86389.1 hypothetical protein CEUSTIGMA_g13800.t1 [Chlamydomonas eustigma]
MPAKKQKTSPGDGVKRTQQTLSESLKAHKQRKDHEVEINSGRIEVQTMQANYLLLEDKYVTTSTSSVDKYKRESRLCQSTLGRTYLPRNLTTKRSLRKQSSFEGLCIDEEEDRGTLGSSGRWEEHGLAFLDVLAMHLSKTTALPIKYQELLLHMVLNADSHREVVNLSSRALELLMVNANLHPGSQQDMKHPHILHCNRDLWRPENK